MIVSTTALAPPTFIATIGITYITSCIFNAIYITAKSRGDVLFHIRLTYLLLFLKRCLTQGVGEGVRLAQYVSIEDLSPAVLYQAPDLLNGLV